MWLLYLGDIRVSVIVYGIRNTITEAMAEIEFNLMREVKISGYYARFIEHGVDVEEAREPIHYPGSRILQRISHWLIRQLDYSITT